MGNVYMEADQVRFKNSTYRNVQEGLAAALEGGGGGGTTVVANPEGSATADLSKLQVGATIYGIPAEAGDISYDNTSSGLTADDVQEAIDELNTGLSGVTELIPSGATSSNKLATASDIPDAVTGNPSGSATAGNLTKLQIGSDIYNISSASTPYLIIDTDVILLSDLTWAQSASGVYYGYINSIVPSGYKAISITLIGWDNFRTSDTLTFFAPFNNNANIGIMAPSGTFESGADIKLRLICAPTA